MGVEGERVERDPNIETRERETGRDDNLNDRKVGCRNAPKLAITGWEVGWWTGGGKRQEGAAA